MMDVFETNEDKQAREREARWAKEVEKAKAADPTKCCGMVYGSGTYASFHGHRCTKPAKFHREETLGTWDQNQGAPTVTRHYCGVHDPVSQGQRQEKKWAEERRERDEKWAREQRLRDRNDLIMKAVGFLTNDELVRLANLQTELKALLNGVDGRSCNGVDLEKVLDYVEERAEVSREDAEESAARIRQAVQS